jgi:hypothetical protein
MTGAKLIHTMSATELEAAFAIEDAACEYFVARRWPDGVTCPRCGSHEVERLKSAKWKWRCVTCGKGGSYHFSHIAGTVLENTKLPLRNWFRLLHLKLNSAEEIGTAEVRRRLGFSYKTAWNMCHRVDAVLGDSSFRHVVGFPAAPSKADAASTLESACKKETPPQRAGPRPHHHDLPGRLS